MAEKELRKLKRRELLEMLLVQCEETERLQQELKELTGRHEQMTESYERLKLKLNVKDERLNQKDEQIRELKNTIEGMQASRTIELEEAGSIAEASLRLNGIFEAAQRAAEQYLMNVKRISLGKGQEKSNYKSMTEKEEKSDQIEELGHIEVSDQLAVPEERTGYRAFTVSDRRISGGQRIPYESGWKMVSRRKKLHG